MKKPKIILKFSEGFVTQKWDNGKFVGQTFTSGNDTNLEDNKGNALDCDLEPEYEPYPMIKEETRVYLKELLEEILDEEDVIVGKRKMLEDALKDLT